MRHLHHTYDDTQLVKLLNKGDEAAFTEIYNRYWEKLYLVAFHSLEVNEEAKELVQNVFLDVWRRRASIQLQYSLSTYLVTAVKYQVINLMASKSRRRRFEGFQHPCLVAVNDTENKLDFDELQRTVATLVRSLPEKCKIVYELKQQGQSQKEIAAGLHISEKTVENHLAAARAKLRMGLMGSGASLPLIVHLFFSH